MAYLKSQISYLKLFFSVTLRSLWLVPVLYGRNNVCVEEHQNHNAYDQSVADEDAGRVRAKVAQQKPDRGVANDARNNCCYGKRRVTPLRQILYSLFEFK